MGGIDAAIENFLSTGNVHSSSDLGLMQDKGSVNFKFYFMNNFLINDFF